MPDEAPQITGTSISVVMNANRWKTPRRLYEELIGSIERDDLSKVEAVEMGIELEDTVARIFTKRTGLKLRRAPKRYEHQTLPFSCQVDRLVEGTDELCECKTASAWMAKEWEDQEIPLEYELQVQWQLMLTGRSVGHIACLIGGQRFVYKKIQADPELHVKMRVAAMDFLENVKNRIPPAPGAKDNPMMVLLYPHGRGDVQEASEDINIATALLQQTKAEIIELEKQKAELEAKLKDAIGDLTGLRTREYTVKWIDVKGSTFTVTKPDSRQLRVTKNKE